MTAFESLGIDIYSLVVYTVNFGLIVIVVFHFLNKPIIKILEKRTSTIKNNLEEAEKLKDHLSRQQNEMIKERDKMRTQMTEEIRLLNVELDRKRSEAEKEIESQRVKMLEEIKEISINQKRALRDEIKSDLVSVIKNIVLNVTSISVTETDINKSMDDAWKEYDN